MVASRPVHGDPAMLALRLLVPFIAAVLAAATILAAPPPTIAADPTSSCEQLGEPALDETVITTVTATGVTVSWSYPGQPSYARACVWPSGTQDANGVGALDRFLAPGTTSRFFSWADFGLAQSPCVASPNALFRTGVHIENIAASRRGTFASCPVTEFYPLDPVRLLDTRTGNGLSGTFKANTARTWQISGRGGIPANALAVTGNLTVTGSTKAGYMSVGPTAATLGVTSSLNFPAGDIRANGVTLPLGPSGALSAIYKAGAGGSTHVVFDVTGYFREGAAGGATFFAVDPVRLLDTRVGNGLTGAFAAETPRTWQISGLGGIPSDATAITANLTVVDQTAMGYVSMGPIATSTPTTSNLNFPVGDIRANGTTVKLSATGTLSAVYKAPPGATTHLALDVTGYFKIGLTGARFFPLEPARILDTRVGNGLSGTFVSSTPRTWTVGGRGGVNASAIAVVGNVTVVSQTRAGYASVTPEPTATPTTSTINFPVGDIRANGLTVKLGTAGKLSGVYKSSSGATTHLIFDAFGYYK